MTEMESIPEPELWQRSQGSRRRGNRVLGRQYPTGCL